MRFCVAGKTAMALDPTIGREPLLESASPDQAWSGLHADPPARCSRAVGKNTGRRRFASRVLRSAWPLVVFTSVVGWCSVGWLASNDSAWAAPRVWQDVDESEESRTWTDDTGQFKVEAKLLTIQRSSVVLLMANGDKKKVPLERLSESDREYIAGRRKEILAANAEKKREAMEANRQGDEIKDTVAKVLTQFTQSAAEIQQSESDRGRLQLKLAELANGTGSQLLDLVKDVPQSDVALEVYTWILRNARGGTSFAEVADRMVEHHADSDQIVLLLPMLRPGVPQHDRWLEQLLDKTTNKQVKGNILFNTATQLAAYNNADAEKRAVEIFKDIEQNYATSVDARQRPLGPLATEQLFILQNLSIGKVAPDIEGTDLDGVAFKLSDYRGKVVVLDFWGDW